GVSGSKKDGINHLQVVAEGGKYAQDDAQVLLVIIYSRENQPERALELISRLSSRYPRNYLLGVERAVMLYRLGRHDEGARVFNELLNNSDITADATDVVSYQYGEALMETGKYGDAGLRYKAVMDWPKSEPDLVTLAHLRRGQALDALGRHDEARKEYQTVLKRDDAYNCHNLARKYNKKPYIPSAN
ncbi:MAG TPA: tetratricopeptide repeat protein, partial [Blastocatellia bacterium]|nr:tetratricopeptide repeat protein [Blastocatellia bacterium]